MQEIKNLINALSDETKEYSIHFYIFKSNNPYYLSNYYSFTRNILWLFLKIVNRVVSLD